MTPYPYQQKIYETTRATLRENRAICLEAPTGAGKTVILSMIVHAVEENNARNLSDNAVYIVAHKRHLVDQISDHLDKWRVPHGVIIGGHEERPGARYHVCTIQSLIRRPPKREPALIIIDEAHHMSPSIITMAAKFPAAKIIGVTASPERLDGRGLSVAADPPGIYDELIRCPLSMRELTAQDYLAPIVYYSIPFSGLDSVPMERGDYRTEEIEELIREGGMYGDAVQHYRRAADGRKCLVFVRSVRSCYDFAKILNASGYRAVALEGTTVHSQRKKIIDDFDAGRLTHLVTCKLVLEGFDLPAISAILDLAPTASRALWRQKVGRLTRVSPGKPDGIYIDPVGSIVRHTQTGDPYESFDWRFFGAENNPRPKVSEEAVDHYCAVCYRYMPGKLQAACPFCGATRKKREAKKIKKIAGELIKLTPKVIPVKDLSPENQRQINEEIAAAVEDEDIRRLREIGAEITTSKKLPYWIYYRLVDKKTIVDVVLLYRIQRALEYKPGWVYFARQHLEKTGLVQNY